MDGMMNTTIHKYPLKVQSKQVIGLPVGAKILDVQVQQGHPCIWALVDKVASVIAVQVSIYGTDHEMPDEPGRYIGTFQTNNDELVFHAFVNRNGNIK